MLSVTSQSPLKVVDVGRFPWTTSRQKKGIMDLGAGVERIQMPSGTPKRNQLRNIVPNHAHHQNWVLLFGKGEHIGKMVNLIAREHVGKGGHQGIVVWQQGIGGWRSKLL
jgi:hypothetical protein